jgi:hypothetical protein
VQPPRDLGAVALDLEEVDGVMDELGEQGLAAAGVAWPSSIIRKVS